MTSDSGCGPASGLLSSVDGGVDRWAAGWAAGIFSPSSACALGCRFCESMASERDGLRRLPLCYLMCMPPPDLWWSTLTLGRGAGCVSGVWACVCVFCEHARGCVCVCVCVCVLPRWFKARPLLLFFNYLSFDRGLSSPLRYTT
jgi:hypothetical protein